MLFLSIGMNAFDDDGIESIINLSEENFRKEIKEKFYNKRSEREKILGN